jgi:hypothetical protein
LNPFTRSSFTFSKLHNQNKTGAGEVNDRLDRVKHFSTCQAPADVYIFMALEIQVDLCGKKQYRCI